MIIAIDGFAGCGKSSTAKVVASELGYKFIDSGAMYRAVTLFVLENKLPLDNPAEIVAHLPKIVIDFEVDETTGRNEILLNSKRVEADIRKMEVSENVSVVAAITEVRHFLVAQQQKMGTQKGIVMDGRDIGTMVFPNAEIKIYMTADVVERAKRRQKELAQKGENVELNSIVSNMEQRDHLDSTREEGPLRQAQDARVLDTTHLTFDQQVAQIIDWIKAA